MAKKHSALALLLLLITGFNAFSQSNTYVYQNYTWEEKPAPFKPEKNDTFPESILLEKIAYEVSIDNEGAYEYYLHHTKTFVNSAQAIERNNRIYLPTGLRSQVLKLKVRVIKPTGEIVLMNDSDIKEAVDEDSERKYKYLAVRGLENGSVIEQIVVLKMPSEFSGRMYRVQSEYPTHNCTFELIYPKWLIFDTRSYNGFPKLEKDSTYSKDGLVCQKATVQYIPPLKEEKYALRVAHLQKVGYKLTGSTRSGSYNINSYDKISDNIFQRLNRELSKPEKKALEKLFKNAQLDYAKNDEDKIRKLEDYLKKTVFSNEDLPNNALNIDEIIEKSVTDAGSLTRLYVAAFNQLNIKHEILVTCNHYETTFEKDFESLNYLDKYFLYFPDYNKYLAPEFPLYRYGLMPYQYRNGYGLMIKKTSLGNLTAGLGSVKFIEPDSYLENTDSLIIHADLTKGLEEINYTYRITNSGHEAATFQCLADYIKEEKDKDKLRRSLMENFSDEAELKDFKVENEGAEYFAKKPYVVSASFTTSKYVDKAGGKYIFKVGELIGPQEQMYQEEARKQPIDMNYGKNYMRVITFKIPQGYKLSNAEKLNMDIFHKDKKGNRDMAFRSWYEIKGDDVTVYVEEYYKAFSLPVEEYEPFKAVINASADFNKIVLLFEPK
ncbi:MAG TPA: DUF3857 domain-containing protein [Chitinophagales bacterium]|nr:DUF3857 domain-containing protein [Chitinophagales bacterium]